MALIRVSGRIEIKGKSLPECDLIINTSHIMFARQDKTRITSSIVHLTNGETLYVTMSFEELWMLIQRET